MLILTDQGLQLSAKVCFSHGFWMEEGKGKMSAIKINGVRKHLQYQVLSKSSGCVTDRKFILMQSF